MSTSCPECNRPLVIEDVTVRSYLGVNVLETCGRLLVPKRKQLSVQGHVVAHGGIEVQGRLSCARAISRGPVLLGPKSDWEGDLRAPSLMIREGAVVQSGRSSIPEDPKTP